MLGVGPDGHVASLFPGSPQLDATDAIAVGVTDSPKPPPERVTLTYEAMDRCRAVWFLVSGEEKASRGRAGPGPRHRPPRHPRRRRHRRGWRRSGSSTGPPRPPSSSHSRRGHRQLPADFAESADWGAGASSGVPGDAEPVTEAHGAVLEPIARSAEREGQRRSSCGKMLLDAPVGTDDEVGRRSRREVPRRTRATCARALGGLGDRRPSRRHGGIGERQRLPPAPYAVGFGQEAQARVEDVEGKACAGRQDRAGPIGSSAPDPRRRAGAAGSWPRSNTKSKVRPRSKSRMSPWTHSTATPCSSAWWRASASISEEESRPTHGCPSDAMGISLRPVPHPSSRTRPLAADRPRPGRSPLRARRRGT